jgi:hypothetical protein
MGRSKESKGVPGSREAIGFIKFTIEQLENIRPEIISKMGK